MPDIMTLYEMTQASGEAHVYLFEDRCTSMQHRRSGCRKCIEACPAEAITLHERELKVNRALCEGCGACSTVCPTEALVSTDPLSELLAAAAMNAMNKCTGRVAIACERVIVRERPRSESVAQVPCLCRVHESLTLELVSLGAVEIVLVDGGCANCKYRHCDAVTDEVWQTANQFLEVAGSEVRVRRAHSFPDWVGRAEDESLGARRRAAFSHARGSAQGTAARAVKFLARHESEFSSTANTLMNALGVDLDETAPVVPHRQEKLVNALFEIGLQNGRDFSQVNASAGAGVTRVGASAKSMSANVPASAGAGVNADADVDVACEETGVDASTGEVGSANVPAGATTSETASANSSDTSAIVSRFFATLHYDTNKCTECGICSAVCRHKALVRSQRKTSAGKNVFLEFTPSLCTQCGLCEDVCFRHAIEVSGEVALSDLFSFEPTEIVIDD